MRSSACIPVLIVLTLAAPAMAQLGVPQPVAVVPPAISAVPSSRSGCTPINPCAVATPDVGLVTMPAPVSPPQPNLPTAAAPAAAARADCPPPRARGGFGRGEGRGGFAGRGAFAGRGFGGRGIPAHCLPRNSAAGQANGPAPGGR